jgi:hypothetical protein
VRAGSRVVELLPPHATRCDAHESRDALVRRFRGRLICRSRHLGCGAHPRHRDAGTKGDPFQWPERPGRALPRFSVHSH